MAAFAGLRNVFQQHRSITVDVYGVILARFILGFPFEILYLTFYIRVSLYHFCLALHHVMQCILSLLGSARLRQPH